MKSIIARYLRKLADWLAPTAPPPPVVAANPPPTDPPKDGGEGL